jgi:hypothetical protein
MDGERRQGAMQIPRLQIRTGRQSPILPISHNTAYWSWNMAGIRLWPEQGVQQTSVGGLLKFGMLCDVELRWNTTSFVSQNDASGTHI